MNGPLTTIDGPQHDVNNGRAYMALEKKQVGEQSKKSIDSGLSQEPRVLR